MREDAHLEEAYENAVWDPEVEVDAEARFFDRRDRVDEIRGFNGPPDPDEDFDPWEIYE